jgi:serine/threonine-protein kinase
MLYEMLTGQAPFNGENLNVVMYQILNAVPTPPNTLNPAVPEMVNFIVAKALSKGVEDRYQNAKDFAADLRACRDSMPRSGLLADLPKANVSNDKHYTEILDISGRLETNEEEANSVPQVGLSKTFDSAEATMRLAALTASSVDVGELSKTLKIALPSAESINRAGKQAEPASPVSDTASLPAQPVNSAQQSQEESSGQSLGSKLLALFIVLFVLFGIILIFVF